ncbi:MAG: recombination associated protein RdgC [Candidatus Endobugula sp.]|jgi:recombination associated protein RdgC
MWFKNLRIYRFTQALTLNGEVLNGTSSAAGALSDALEEGAFVACNSQDESRCGWVSPLTGEADVSLVHACQGFLMLCAKKQEKVLPAAVINEALDEKVAVITEAEGRPVGRTERQSLRDDVMMDLLPKAFTRSSLQYAYIAPPRSNAEGVSHKDDHGYIVVNAASAAKAEALLSVLRDVLGSLPVIPLVSKQLPHQMMTQWLTEAEAPAKFLLGDECELADPKEAGSVIRCKHQDLAAEEINNLLQSGMIVTKLNLNWAQGVDFILDDQLAIKRLRFADDIQGKADEHEAQNAIEKFDSEFSVMTLELSAFIHDLVSALGGVDASTRSVEEMVIQATKNESEHTGVDEVVF